MSERIKFRVTTKEVGERFYKTESWVSNGHWSANVDTVENKAIARAIKGMADGVHVYGYDMEPLHYRTTVKSMLEKTLKGLKYRPARITTDARMRYSGADVECLAVRVEASLAVGELTTSAWISPTYLHLLLECERVELCEPLKPVIGFKKGNESQFPDVVIMPMRVN